jgi:hypothetical protein
MGKRAVGNWTVGAVKYFQEEDDNGILHPDQ